PKPPPPREGPRQLTPNRQQGPPRRANDARRLLFFSGRHILTEVPAIWNTFSRPPVVMLSAVPPHPPPTWRAHAAALFVTFHVACVLIYTLPRPPVLDQDILQHPEVKAEMDQGFGALHKLIPWRDAPEQMRDDALRVVLAYTRF